MSDLYQAAPCLTQIRHRANPMTKAIVTVIHQLITVIPYIIKGKSPEKKDGQNRHEDFK
ncbi:MAG: hypothetical protein J1F06_03905 [Prevotellaceae bacterium]|nr:hypothetical protein [Prevotellaceae bacterium]